MDIMEPLTSWLLNRGGFGIAILALIWTILFLVRRDETRASKVQELNDKLLALSKEYADNLRTMTQAHDADLKSLIAEQATTLTQITLRLEAEVRASDELADALRTLGRGVNANEATRGTEPRRR